MNNRQIAGFTVFAVLVAGLLGWVLTAPYLSNQGLGRTPGIIIGGSPSPAPSDFTPLNDIPGPLLMKQAGFPPLVVYLSFVGTPEGVITATRPDGGYWAQRVRDRGGEGWLRIGDQTFAMTATEIVGDARLPMLEQWGAKAGRSVDEPVYAGAELLRDWEVFYWTPIASTE